MTDPNELCSSDVKEYDVKDYTKNTLSIVVTILNDFLFNDIYSYLEGEYVFIPTDNEDVLIRTECCKTQESVVITLYSSTKRLNIQGKGCKNWWINTGKVIMENLINDGQLSSHSVITSTPKPCVNSITHVKELMSPVIDVQSTQEQPGVTSAKLVDCVTMVINQVQSLQQSVIKLQNDLDCQKMNQESSIANAKSKLKSYILEKTSPSNKSDLDEGVSDQDVIDQLRSQLTSIRAELKLTNQEKKALLTELKLSNDQNKNQLDIIIQLQQQMKKKVHQGVNERVKITEKSIAKENKAETDTWARHVSQVRDPVSSPQPNPPTPESQSILPNTRAAVNENDDWNHRKNITSNHYEAQKTLLIGTSILKLVNKRGLSRSVDVSTNRGAIIPKLRKVLFDLDLTKYATIIVHAGGNDLSQGESISDIIYEYERLLNVIISNSTDINVLISGVTPRRDTDVYPLNDALARFCHQHSLRFIDNYSSVNNNECMDRDGIHLSRRGTSQLLQNINEATAIFKSNHTMAGAFNGRSKCGYCGESGHTERRCRHGMPIQCRKCNQYGHKVKFCIIDDHY